MIEPPWPIGPDNGKRAGWKDFHEGKPRERCPFPRARLDLLRDWREGWDAAAAHQNREAVPEVETGLQMGDLSLITAAMAIAEVRNPAAGYKAAWERLMVHLRDTAPDAKEEGAKP